MLDYGAVQRSCSQNKDLPFRMEISVVWIRKIKSVNCDKRHSCGSTSIKKNSFNV
jgi:hypothetical protein